MNFVVKIKDSTLKQKTVNLCSLLSRDTTETIESGPLCITDLFQDKSVAYYKIFLEIFRLLNIFFFSLVHLFLFQLSQRNLSMRNVLEYIGLKI